MNAPALLDERLQAFRDLSFVRTLDERMLALQRQGRIGFYGACTGQEAVVVGAARALHEDDWIFPALRESALLLLRGFPLDLYVAQLFGNRRDLPKGRQMPCHHSARAFRQVSWSSCVGSQLPHAVGAAWAAKRRGDRVVTVAFLGDGATSTGDFHAAMNFAAVFRVPCLFVCQNNQYAISVPVARQTAARELTDKASAYGMRARRVDGNDVFAVRQVLTEERARALQSVAPCFIECVTYRTGAHSSSDDPTRYRSSEEVEAWRRRDPLLALEQELATLGVLDDATKVLMQRGIDAELDAAIGAVEHELVPDPRSLLSDVYAEPPWHLREQLALLEKWGLEQRDEPERRR